MLQFRQFENGWTTGTALIETTDGTRYNVCLFITGNPGHAEWITEHGSRDVQPRALGELYAAVERLEPPPPPWSTVPTVHGSSRTRMQAECSTGLRDLDFEVASDLHTPHHAVANDETPRRLYFEGRRINSRDLWRYQRDRREHGRTRTA